MAALCKSRATLCHPGHLQLPCVIRPTTILKLHRIHFYYLWLKPHSETTGSQTDLFIRPTYSLFEQQQAVFVRRTRRSKIWMEKSTWPDWTDLVINTWVYSMEDDNRPWRSSLNLHVVDTILPSDRRWASEAYVPLASTLSTTGGKPSTSAAELQCSEVKRPCQHTKLESSSQVKDVLDNEDR